MIVQEANTVLFSRNDFSQILTPQNVKKSRYYPRDPSRKIRAEILRRIPASRSRMDLWRPIWWPKGVIWGPLGFRAAQAHPWQLSGCTINRVAPLGPQGPKIVGFKAREAYQRLARPWGMDSGRIWHQTEPWQPDSDQCS